jgi:hypothetical protein
MPSEEEENTSEALIHQVTANLLCAAMKCDRTYYGKHKHFCKWVDGERVGGWIPSDQPTYITRLNVDKYFYAIVVKMTTGPKRVRKTVVALKALAPFLQPLLGIFSVLL